MPLSRKVELASRTPVADGSPPAYGEHETLSDLGARETLCASIATSGSRGVSGSGARPDSAGVRAPRSPRADDGHGRSMRACWPSCPPHDRRRLPRRLPRRQQAVVRLLIALVSVPLMPLPVGEQPVIRGLHQRRGVAGLGDLAGKEALEMVLIGRSQRTVTEMPAD